MPEDRVLRTLTLAMKAINALATELDKALKLSTCLCPVCTTHRSFIQAEQEKVEDKRRLLIVLSRSRNDDERLITAYSVSEFTTNTTEALRQRTALCSQSHLAQETLMKLRLTAIAVGKGSIADREMLRRAIEAVPDGPERDHLRQVFKSMPEDFTDPTKMN